MAETGGASASLRVGIVGCGTIADIYVTNMPRFRDLAPRACADLRPEAADAVARKAGIDAVPVDTLLADPDIDVVLNLTVPNAHAEVTGAALAAGKHVYSEKPLAVTAAEARRLVAEAERLDLRLGMAPDTILGAGQRISRSLIDDGDIGRVVAGTAYFLSPGMESWHPNPAFFFKPGGGPVLDMGPYYLTALVNLIGPVARVAALDTAGHAERVVAADSPHKGERIAVEVPTTALALLDFASGARVVFGTSWDVRAHGQRPLELYGTAASLRPPDPNFMGGMVQVADAKDAWTDIDPADRPFGAPNWPADAPRLANDRGLGLAEMAAAIRAGRPHRLDGRLGLHVLEVAEAIAASARDGRFVDIASTVDRPPAMTDADAAALLA